MSPRAFSVAHERVVARAGESAAVVAADRHAFDPYPAFGVFFDEPVTLIVRTGGPGEGGFTVCFDSIVADFGCEEETLINGQIKEQVND